MKKYIITEEQKKEIMDDVRARRYKDVANTFDLLRELGKGDTSEIFFCEIAADLSEVERKYRKGVLDITNTETQLARVEKEGIEKFKEIVNNLKKEIEQNAGENNKD